MLLSCATFAFRKPIMARRNSTQKCQISKPGPQFIKVLDRRKQPIRGLRVPNDILHALNVENTQAKSLLNSPPDQPLMEQDVPHSGVSC